MKVWPRRSISVDSVCSDIFDARYFAGFSFSAVFNIRTFTISRFSNWRETSLTTFRVAPSLPTRIVGFSALISRLI